MRLPPPTRRAATVLGALALVSCAGLRSAGPSSSAAPGATGAPAAPRVGPHSGSVMVVGGGSIGPDLWSRFIELAGGPDALIVDVPTAGGDSVYPPDWRGANALKSAGARNVVVLHTKDRRVADSDSFAAPLARAGGVWFEGGRQWHLVDSYAGTKTEQAFHDVLARGGIVGGSSAGASILASFLVRGAREGNTIMVAPAYLEGFGFLRNTAIDQHVVARERLRDLADSVMPRFPELLGMSEDEGTAWLVRGDIAEIVGKSKAFVYGSTDRNDPGRPFLTLRPGDRYDLGARRVIHRAISDSPLTEAFVDSLFSGFARGSTAGAAVLVAQEGRILVNKAYGLPDPAGQKYMPATTVPNFSLGAISEALNIAATRGTDTALKRGSKGYGQALARRAFTPLGMHKTVATDSGDVSSNVDELYRWELGLSSARSAPDTARDGAQPADPAPASPAATWRAESYRGLPRAGAYGTSEGRRHAFVRIPAHRVAIIVLTNRADADAKAIADRLTDRLLFTSGDARWKTQRVSSTSGCRSVSAVNALVVWAGCSSGRVFRTVDGGETWNADSVPGAARLDFRGIKAFDASTAVITSAGPAEEGAARIYRTTDGGAHWTLAWSDSTRGIFLDGIAFWDAQHGFTFSDPVEGRLVILTTDDGGAHWSRVPGANVPPVIPGEAAFAASNTQLAVQGAANAWIATGGGAEARVFRTTDRGRTWHVSSTGKPGGASAGLFGIAFADPLNGLAVGGDYRIARGVTDFAIRTTDGGVTWRSAGVRRPDGVTQGLALVPGTSPAVFVATGAYGTAFTSDFGASWQRGDTLTSWGVSFAGPGVGWVVGPRGRIARFNASPKK